MLAYEPFDAALADATEGSASIRFDVPAVKAAMSCSVSASLSRSPTRH
jgi:hypothetical protein